MKFNFSILLICLISLNSLAQTFQDNVTNETIGDFPSQWDIVGGMAIVNHQDGYKYIGFRSGGIIKPIVNGQTNDYLSGDFTIEFDIFFDQTSSLYGQRFQLRLWDGAYGYDKDGIRYKPFMIYRDGLETDWNHPEMGGAKNHLTELQTLDVVWRHVKVEVKEGNLKILMDDQIVLFLPRFKMQPTMVSIGGSVNDSQFEANIGFTNFTITNILSQTKLVMLVDKETDEVIDINLLSNIKNNTALQESYSNTVAYLGSITGNYSLRPVDVTDVKKPNLSTNPINNQTVRPVDVADVKKPINIDVNAYGKYTVLPAKEAQLVFDFDTKYETRKLGIKPTQTIVANQQSWFGNYFESNTALPLTAHELILENGTLKLIGETEKNLDIPPNDGECGTYPTEAQLQVLADPNSLFNRRLRFLQNFSIDDLRGVPAVQQINGEFVLPQQVRFSTTPTENYTVIPIVAHIFRQSNHTGGLSLEDLYASIQRANNLFDAYGVFLHLDKVKFIDDDNLFNANVDKTLDNNKNNIADYIENLGILNRNISKKVNLYFVENSKTSWTNFPSLESKKQHIIMQNGQTRNQSTLAHEIGHWFNLLHTHDTENGVEKIDGSNCSTAGDLCCDTPADPKLDDSAVDNSSCNYLGTDTDASKNNYAPDPTNLMSYSRKKCRDNFTDEQVMRMYNAYLGMEDERGYTLEVNKEIGEKTQTLSLNPGWKAVQHFESAGKVYMIFFNDSTSEIAVNQITTEGKKGSQVDYKDYNSNMSFVGVFRKGVSHYLALINYEQGQLGIIKLNTNGSFGAAQAYQVGLGWGRAFVAKDEFLVLFKKQEGNATYRLNSDGRLGEKMKEDPYFYKSSHIVESYGQNMIFYDPNDGYARKASITEYGRFNLMTGEPKFVDNNWTTVSYVHSLNNNGQKNPNIIFLDKNTGQIKQYRLTENWKIGESWYDSAKINANLEPGFDTLAPFDVFDGNRYRNYVMISNSTTGKIITYHLNNNL